MAHSTVAGESCRKLSFNSMNTARRDGYTILILLLAIAVLSIGLLVAIPVWETQLQREKEEELLFRGKQYVEAIRRYQILHPGTFPESLDELLEEKCIRKLFPDPMTEHGEWNLILPSAGVSTTQGKSPQKVLVVPYNIVDSVKNLQIIGVVSSSQKRSFKIYLEQESYDTWLFFYGQDPKKMPEILTYGQAEKEK